MSKPDTFGAIIIGIAPYSSGGTYAGMVDRGPFGLGGSLPALDAAGHRYRALLVSVRLGHAVEFGGQLRTRVARHHSDPSADVTQGADSAISPTTKCLSKLR
jgi:hypothetical protein